MPLAPGGALYYFHPVRSDLVWAFVEPPPGRQGPRAVPACVATDASGRKISISIEAVAGDGATEVWRVRLPADFRGAFSLEMDEGHGLAPAGTWEVAAGGGQVPGPAAPRWMGQYESRFAWPCSSEDAQVLVLETGSGERAAVLEWAKDLPTVAAGRGIRLWTELRDTGMRFKTAAGAVAGAEGRTRAVLLGTRNCYGMTWDWTRTGSPIFLRIRLVGKDGRVGEAGPAIRLCAPGAAPMGEFTPERLNRDVKLTNVELAAPVGPGTARKN